MKAIKRHQKSQTLIVVLILLFLGSIISTGLMRMWESEITTNAVSDDGRLAFYLAQAAVERGKYELRQDWNYDGTGAPVNMGAGNYTVNITVLSSTPPERKRVTGVGRVRQATRQLQVEVVGTSAGGPCPPVCAPDTQVCGRDPECGAPEACWIENDHFCLGKSHWLFSWPGEWIFSQSCYNVVWPLPPIWGSLCYVNGRIVLDIYIWLVCGDPKCRFPSCCRNVTGACTTPATCNQPITGADVTPGTWGTQ
jgi:Tfp pilus assembly protein PilX